MLVHLDLSKYNSKDIIKMIETGLVTVSEVVESGVSYLFFSEELTIYLQKALKTEQTKPNLAVSA